MHLQMWLPRRRILLPGKRQRTQAGQILYVSMIVPLVLAALLGGSKLRWEQSAEIPMPTHVVATAMGITVNFVKEGKVYYHSWCSPFPYADTVSSVRVVATWQQFGTPPVTDERTVRTLIPWDCGTDRFIAGGVLRVPEEMHGDVPLRLAMEWYRPGMDPDGPPAAHIERQYIVTSDDKLRRG